MQYSQKQLLGLFHSGIVPGESSFPKHIETVISNIYLFEKHAYKIYKNDNNFFNSSFHNLLPKRERFDFAKSDFEWNQKLTPEIYLDLKGVRVNDGVIQFVNFLEAEELVFVTKRIPSDDILIHQIQNGILTDEDYFEMGRQFAQREQRFVWNKKQPSQTPEDNILERYGDIVSWIEGVEELAYEEKKLYAETLKTLIESVRSWGALSIVTCFDFHCLNAFYSNGILYPFDTHPPKDEWGVGPTMLNIYRLAADIGALAGEREMKAVLQGYCDQLNRPMLDNEAHRCFILYASLIMVSYLYMLGKTDPDKKSAAQKYHTFVNQLVTK